jgi:hypothetical protein
MDDAIGAENVQVDMRSCHDLDRVKIGRAICASLLLHLLFFLILARTASHFTFYPTVGAFEHFDFIWVTPSPEPSAPAVTTEASAPRENSGSRELTAGAVNPSLREMAEPMAVPPSQHPGPGKEPAVVQRPLEVDTVVSLEVLKRGAPPDKRAGEPKKGALTATKKETRDKPQPAAELPDGQRWHREKTAERPDSKAMPGDAIGKNKHPEQEQDAVALRMEEEIADQQQHHQEKLAGGKTEPEVIVQQVRPVGEQEKRSEPVVLVTTVPEKDAAERSAEQARLLMEQEKRVRQAALDITVRENAVAEKVAEQARLIREQEKRSRQATLEKAAQEKAARERIAEPARPVREREASKRQVRQQRIEHAAPTATRKLGQSQAALPKATSREPAARQPEAPGSRLMPGQKPQLPLPVTRIAQGGDLPALAVPKSEPAEALKPSERLSGNQGLIIASPRGDLKLVLTGDTTINLSVRFREYPKKRRNKVTRSEARKMQTLAPILTRTREDTREAVIVTAREGVYTFSAESKQEKGSRATFTLKLFESGSGEKIAKLGARTVSGKAVLVKVLMPEAIIWDDESAFTGTMEDSDSESKFNTETGLFWKEFHD